VEFQKRFSDPGLVAKWRKEELTDITHENVVLFIQHGLMYRDFTNSMRSGDSGRVLHCLKFFTIGSRSSNYLLETIPFIVFVKSLVGKTGEVLHGQLLLNLSGSRKGPQQEDLVCKLQVQEQTACRNLINHPALNKWHQEVISPIIFKL
jgi:hypothetical protein